MSAVQLSLDLRERKSRRKAGPKLAARMMSILAVRGDWTTRRQLAHYGLNDRACRLGREWAHGRVIASRLGYKLLRYATPEEIREAGNAILRQIEAEQRNYAMLTRRAHEALHKRGVA